MQRLERMERRMALLKQKGRLSNESVEGSNQEKVSVPTENPENIEIPSSPSSPPKDNPKSPPEKVKRKSSTDSPSHAKRKSPVHNIESSEIPEASEVPTASEAPIVSETPKDQVNSETVVVSEGSAKEPEDKNDAPTKTDILRTDIMYFSNFGGPLRSPDSPARDEEVLVPSWRIHHVTSCYQLEGTENLDDDVFSKRHQKFEIDERRRKRWDVQRIREQRLNEKLKRGRSNKVVGPSVQEQEVSSFFPNPEEAQFLEVSDTVPVCAFGFPVPNFQPCEFSLPWFIMNNDDKDMDKTDKVDKTDKTDKIDKTDKTADKTDKTDKVDPKQKTTSPNVKKVRTSDGKHGS